MFSLARWNRGGHCVRSLSTAASGAGRIPIAVVGAGPAGFYTAKYLLAANSNVAVDLYEEENVPFGA